MTRPIGFELLKKSSKNEARRGRVTTPHGVIETPVFMPVGTLASVKSLDSADVENLGARIMLNNAYHLMLRPGSDRVARFGGLHKFANYNGAILTDSGGFQVFSLSGLRRVTDRGVTFRSHIDGALIDLTPEKLVQVQEELGPDIAMVLDECPPAQASREVVVSAMRRTTAWAKRCLDARTRDDMGWFGIVQGALFEDLRSQHVRELTRLPFDGFAVGGVSVGESTADIVRIVQHTTPQLPQDKPRYLMGVGTPEDLVRGVASGIDMFDCVMPTRNARNGQFFTSTGKVIIKNAEHRDSDLPIDANCDCHTCTRYTRAYLRHLFVAGEMTYHRLASLHNVAFYLKLMERIRGALEADAFVPEEFLSALAPRKAA